MNKLIIVLIMLVALVTPSFAVESDYLPQILVFPLGTTNAGTGAVSTTIVKVPANITVTGVFVSDSGGIAKDATDTAVVTLSDASTTLSTHTTATTAVTANVPLAMTITAAHARVAKNAVLKCVLTKGASGKATTNASVYITYIVGW